MRSLLLPLACLVLASSLYANGGGYIKGVQSTGAFQPIGIDQVQMLSERLEIDLHIEYADIRIEYLLHNPGKKIKIEAGFPSAIAVAAKESENAMEPETLTPTLESLQLQIDGKALKAEHRPDKLKIHPASMFDNVVVNSWHIFKLDFAAGQTRRLTVAYRNPYYTNFMSISSNDDSSPLSLTYLFSAAAAWSGPIRQGTVIVKALTTNASTIQFSHPKRFIKDGNTWTWSFTDFEPTLEDDLSISLRPGYHSIPAEYIKGTGDNAEYIHLGSYVSANSNHHRNNATYVGEWSFHRKDFKTTASSYLKEDDVEHLPENTTDYDNASAWVEGKDTDGIGEFITLTLPKPSKITRVGIVNGYTKSKELYFANNRPSKLKVSVNDSQSFIVDVPDEYLEHERFWFDLPKQASPVKTIKLEIAAVHAGSRYADTAISEIVLVQPLDKPPKFEPVR